MGRVVRREIVGFRCELRSCDAFVAAAPPVPEDTTWLSHVEQLAALVEVGWSMVLHPKLRMYCPEHADRVWQCTCRTNPRQAHLCTSHDADAASLAWDQITLPDVVKQIMETAA